MATLKNTAISGSLTLPSGTTAQRPVNPPNGALRFNTTLGYAEIYLHGFWGDIVSGTDLPVGRDCVCWLDANVPESNTGSGTTWYDLSGNNHHGTLNSITRTTNGSLSTNNQNVMQCNASSSSYIDVVHGGLDLRTVNTGYTVMHVTRYSGGTRGRTWNAASNNWLLGHWSSGATNHYAEGWVYGASGGGQVVNDENWRCYAATGKIDRDHYSFWIDGQRVAFEDTGGSNGPNSFRFGTYTNFSEVSNAQTALFMAWNRALSSDEVKQTQNAIQTRFGLTHNQVYSQG